MRVLTMVLTGGRGQRLYPLTRHRAKPAVPFGGNYRLIDFVLSNLVNSGLNAIYVLVQYLSQSLIEHLRVGWRAPGMTTDQFITVVPPQMRHGLSWYRGSADAVAQNLNLIQNFRPDALAVFAGDLVFRMDVAQMIEFHRRTGAEATLLCSPVPVGEAKGRLGVACTDSSDRIVAFAEKPTRPEPMPGQPTHALASMGCFLFEPATLIAVLAEAMRDERAGDRSHDLSRDVFPRFVERGRAFAYFLERNEVPGLKPYERRAYWRDIGTIGSYWAAHMDLLGGEPPFDLRNSLWPIYPARVNMPATSFLRAEIDSSLIGEGGRVEDATVRRSVVGRGVTIEAGAVIEESVVMHGTRIGAGCRIRRAIIDRFNDIKPATVLDPDHPAPDERCVIDTSAKLIVVPRGGAAPPVDRLSH
ncbi:glucose-1-phosphate adenylyltransferase [Candidatus Sumerlaeota bacterium]|nr:glucose-1-phosphate adenylyltransferase [Candidatus Sumerlaeota bacterium]